MSNPEDFTISGVSNKKRKTCFQAYEIEEIENELIRKKHAEEEAAKILAGAIFGLAAIAIMAASLKVPIAVAVVTTTAVSFMVAGSLLFLYFRQRDREMRKKREREHIELQELEHSTSTTRDWYKGRASGKHLYRMEETGPVDLHLKNCF